MFSVGIKRCSVNAVRSIFILTLTTGLAGCDQLGDRLSAVFPAPTAEKTLADMASHEASSATDKAIRIGETYISKSPNPDDSVRRELIKLYLQEGDSSSAMRHLRLVKGVSESVDNSLKGELASPQSPSGPLAPGPPSTPGGRQVQDVAVDGASVTVGPNGVEVRAGDAVVRTPR